MAGNVKYSSKPQAPQNCTVLEQMYFNFIYVPGSSEPKLVPATKKQATCLSC